MLHVPIYVYRTAEETGLWVNSAFGKRRAQETCTEHPLKSTHHPAGSYPFDLSAAHNSWLQQQAKVHLHLLLLHQDRLQECPFKEAWKLSEQGQYVPSCLFRVCKSTSFVLQSEDEESYREVSHDCLCRGSYGYKRIAEYGTQWERQGGKAGMGLPVKVLYGNGNHYDVLLWQQSMRQTHECCVHLLMTQSRNWISYLLDKQLATVCNISNINC